MATLVCALAVFAVGGVATAQAKRLSFGTAKNLATLLAQKQVRGRNIVSFHLQRLRRASPTRIVFAYDDRSADHVFCTALVIVSSRTGARRTTISARFAGQHCAGIPSEVLKFESLTRRAQRGVRSHTLQTAVAVDAVRRAGTSCRNVKVPRSRVLDAQALFDIALVEALERPSDAELGNFTSSLVALDASDPTLAASASAWADYVATVRSLPTVAHPCGALKAWKNAGFRGNAAPIDFAAYHSLDRRAGQDRQAILRGARLMLAKGAFPNAVIGFTPDGLLLQASTSTAVVRGKTRGEKLVLG
jgi:hypothetical protein